MRKPRPRNQGTSPVRLEMLEDRVVMSSTGLFDGMHTLSLSVPELIRVGAMMPIAIATVERIEIVIESATVSLEPAVASIANLADTMARAVPARVTPTVTSLVDDALTTVRTVEKAATLPTTGVQLTVPGVANVNVQFPGSNGPIVSAQVGLGRGTPLNLGVTLGAEINVGPVEIDVNPAPEAPPNGPNGLGNVNSVSAFTGAASITAGILAAPTLINAEVPLAAFPVLAPTIDAPALAPLDPGAALAPDYQVAAEPGNLLPESPGLLGEIAPVNLGAMENALQSFIDQLDELRATFTSWLSWCGPTPWVLLALAVLATAYAGVRQHMQRVREGRRNGAKDEDALAWDPNLWTPRGEA